jgi:hypothetical protein
MIPRISVSGAGIGWQTTMADLALILFIVAAAGVHASQQRPEMDKAVPSSDAPLAVYRSGQEAPPLAAWLEQQAPDERQQLTITVHYPKGDPRAAAERALEMAQQARAAGQSARIVLEEGPGSEEQVVLAFDRSEGTMARTLQNNAQD